MMTSTLSSIHRPLRHRAAEAGLPEARRQVEQRIADDLVAEFPQLAQP